MQTVYKTQIEHFALHDTNQWPNNIGTANNEIKYICDDILKRLPMPGELKASSSTTKHPIGMILKREVKRFNGLLELIRHSLIDLKHSINGMAIADQYFSETVSEIANNKIPSIWLKRSYLSAKTLAGYIDDLSKRIEFFQMWNRFGTPQAFWFSAFYFPQALITTTIQCYAKQFGMDFDDVDIKIEMTSFETVVSDEFETFMKV